MMRLDKACLFINLLTITKVEGEIGSIFGDYSMVVFQKSKGRRKHPHDHGPSIH